MKTLIKGSVAAAVVGLTVSLLAGPAHAVPAWSRKTGLDCTACHFGGTNRLTKMGEDFLVRGHRMPGDEGAYKDYTTIKFSDYASLASKFRFVGSDTMDPSTAFDVESFALYTGGPLTEQFSYFTEYYFHERGPFANANETSTTTTNRSKLADSYLFYSSTPAKPQWWFARGGQIYPYIIYWASSGGRVSIGRPRAINNNVGGGTLYTPRDRAYGVSGGYYAVDGLMFEAGIVNSAGGNARPNIQEVNNHKDLFLTAEKMFDSHGSGIGAYLYSGRFRFPPTDTTNVQEYFSNAGILAQFVRDQFELSGAAFFSQHTNPNGPGRRSPSSYYLEAAYNMNPGLTIYGRLDGQDNDLSPGAGTTGNVSNGTGGALGISQRIGWLGRIVSEVEFFRSKNVNAAGTALVNSSSRSWTTEINWLF